MNDQEDLSESFINHKEKILSHFKCQKSGNCCRTSGVVYATQPEINTMAKSLNIDITTFLNRYVQKKNGWLTISNQRFRPNCFLTEKNTCKLYKDRPKQCKTYPNWPEIWESKNNFLKETLLCPGLKKAFTDYNKTSPKNNP